MTNDQFATYLAELRQNRSAQRPTGPREPVAMSNQQAERQPAAQAQREHDVSQRTSLVGPRSSSVTPSVRSRYSTGPNARDYYPGKSVAPLKPSDVVPTATYIERGQRWMEKEEAFSIRQAMKDMDLRSRPNPDSHEEDDQRLYEAALDEASDLVWQHQHGVKPSKPDGPYRYRPHLRKNSYAHARTASVGMYGDEIGATGLARDCSRSASGSSTEGDRSPMPGHQSPVQTPDSVPPVLIPGRMGDPQRPYSTAPRPKQPASIATSGYAAVEGSRRLHGARRPLPSISRPSRNTPSAILEVRDSQSTGQPRPASRGLISKVDLHYNPPSRSRDPQYTSNPAINGPPRTDTTRNENGIEIRGEDIREATSMRLGDRSSKLPTPTAVSDTPGRPIVSFDANWTPPDQSADGNSESRCENKTVGIPSVVVTGQGENLPRSPAQPSIPCVIVGDEAEGMSATMPTIQEPSKPSTGTEDGPPVIPAITVSDDQPQPKARPLPQPGRFSRRPRASRPLADTDGLGSTLCHECGLPLKGRFVALAGKTEKFHPQCLSCFVCGTSLEALEISPEPQPFRDERLERITRRAAGEVLDEEPGKTMAEDGDDRLRFYCHLDWHELFAPRCKHCKTPILGEHIVALGEHWHYGHFFCAECGDPFEHGMTHIEKDGYAWCVSCQTKRTERRAPKCKKCNTAVVGEYVQALGGEWHDACFRCTFCSGAFEDGQIFPRETGTGTVVLCTRCRARELKQ